MDPGLPLGGVLLVQMRVKRAKFWNHALFPENYAHFSCIFASQTELQQLGVSEVQIFAKVGESTALLASILVREGVLLIQTLNVWS